MARKISLHFISVFAYCIVYPNLICILLYGVVCTNVFVFSPGVIESIAVSAEGALLCSVGDDQAMKVFDVVNFDMINMLKLG